MKFSFDYFLILFLLLYHKLHPNHSFPALYPFLVTLLSSPSFSFRNDQASQKYEANMVYQVARKLGTSPHVKAEQENLEGGKNSKNTQKVQRQSPLLPLGVPKNKLHNHIRGPVLAPCYPDCWLSLCDCPWVQVCKFCSFSCGMLDPFVSFLLLFCRVSICLLYVLLCVSAYVSIICC